MRTAKDILIEYEGMRRNKLIENYNRIVTVLENSHTTAYFFKKEENWNHYLMLMDSDLVNLLKENGFSVKNESISKKITVHEYVPRFTIFGIKFGKKDHYYQKYSDLEGILVSIEET